MKRGRSNCPYLDTVDRSVLDFDYEKVCSVTLSTRSVYACLVCGAFFSGRGVGTPAHTHSLSADHHVFLCFATQRAYCLPDDYEIGGHALDDVRRVLGGLLRGHLAVAHDDDLVADVYEVGGGTVQADDTAAGLAGDGVGLEAVAVVDVRDLDLLVLADAGGVQEVLVDGDGTDVVELGLGDRGAVNLALEHVELHCSRSL